MKWGLHAEGYSRTVWVMIRFIIMGWSEVRSATLLGALALLAGCQSARNVADGTSPHPSVPWQEAGAAMVGTSGRVDAGATIGAAPAARDGLGVEVALPSPGVVYALGNPGALSLPGEAVPEAALTQPLTLAEVVSLALAHQPSTRRAWLRAQAQAAVLQQSRAAYWPSVRFSVGISREESEGGNIGNFGGVENRFGPSLSASWLLYDFGRREATVAAAEAALLAQNLGFNASLQAVMAEAARAYFELAAAEGARAANEAFRENAAATLRSAERRLENDLGNRPDVLRARADLLGAEAALASDRSRIEAGRAALSVAIGQRVNSRLAIQPLETAAELPLPQGEVESLLALALQRRDSLRSTVAEREAAAARLREARASTAPAIVLDGGASWSGYTGDRLDDGHQYRVGLALQWSLFEGFRRRYAIAERRAALSEADTAVEEAELRVVGEVWSAYFAWQGAQEQVAATRAAVEAREEALAAIRRGFDNGLNSLLDLLTAQQDLAVSRRLAVDALAALGTSRVNLATAVGVLGER